MAPRFSLPTVATVPGCLTTLFVITLLAGCFRHPHPDYEGRSCSVEKGCPEHYTCDPAKLECRANADGGIDAAADRGGAESVDGRDDGRDDDAREVGRLAPDGGVAAIFEVLPDTIPAAADASMVAQDADDGDVPAGGIDGAAGGAGGASGKGGSTGTGGSGPGGSPGSGGTTGGVVSTTGGTTASGGIVAGGTSTSGTGGASLGGTTSLADAAVDGPVGTVDAGADAAAIPQPGLVASVQTLDLGDAPQGESSTEGSFTLTNKGADTVSFTLTSTNSDFSFSPGGSNTCGSTLAHDASCTVRVVFKPANTAATGPKSSTIQFVVSPDNKGEVSVTGNVTAGAALSTEPVRTITFPTGSVGERNAEMTFTIANVGPRPTGAISLSSNNPDFVLQGDCNGTKLDAASSCTVRVTMTPSTSGHLTGVLSATASPGGTVSVTAAGDACPMYQHLHGTTCGDGSPYPLGNLPVPSAGCGNAQGMQALLTEGQSQDVDTGLGTAHRLAITSGTDAREYVIDIPSTYDPSKPYRVFFAFHWINSTGTDVAKGSIISGGAEISGFFGLRHQALLAGAPAIFIAPQALSGIWAAGTPQDSILFDDILAKVQASLCIDTSRVFATGFSFGGMMTYSLSTTRPKVLRAAVGIAPANYNIYIPNPLPRDPIPWMSTTGMSDGTTPWLNKSNGKGASQIATLRGADNGCTVPETIPTWTDASPTRHFCYDFVGCNPIYPLKACTFDGNHQSAPYDAAAGDSGTQSWVPPESWKFFSQF